MRYALIFFLAVFLSGCGVHNQYVPAPHEMAMLPIGFSAPPVNEDDVQVHMTQPVKLDMLKTLMKTRGYMYLGYRVFRASYQPSKGSLAEAAASINASTVLYFVAGQEVVKETKKEYDYSKLIKAKKREDYSAVFSDANSKEVTEDVTYHTFLITYWAKITEKSAEDAKQFLLAKEEVEKLRVEKRTLERTLPTLERRLKKLESQAAKVPPSRDGDQDRKIAALGTELDQKINELRDEINRKKNEKLAVEEAQQNDEKRRLDYRSHQKYN